MEITFAPRGILQINDARIIFRNFEGRASQFNREGDRNFALVIPDRDLTRDEVDSILKVCTGAFMSDSDDGPVLVYNGVEVITVQDMLEAAGWNVTVKPPVEDGGSPRMHLKVKIKFNDRGPIVYLNSGNSKPVKLTERTIKCLDQVDIARVDLDIRPYDWEVNGKGGRTAYLQGMDVTQNVDRFTNRYADEEFPEEDWEDEE